jgi:Protein of unknown function (DUF2844)
MRRMSASARKYRLAGTGGVSRAYLLFLISVFILILGNAFPARAALGGDTVSILADQGQMEGSRKVTTANSYTVHEIKAANGTVVREYQGAEGKVFAVAWHGPFWPDMKQILGSYYDQYAQARQAQSGVRGGRHPVVINEPGFVVTIGGHPGWFIGKAYIPEKLPQGMRAEDIQ